MWTLGVARGACRDIVTVKKQTKQVMVMNEDTFLDADMV